MTRYGYLGPAGTFTELALRTAIADAAVSEQVGYPTVLAALDALRRGDIDAAMVPLENSVEGSVSITLDALADGDPLVIVREVVLPVSFALLVRPGTDQADITTVAGHPHAQPQCRGWLAAHLAHAEWEPAASNADAAAAVAEGRWDAALAGSFAAEVYGLEVLVDGIHDVEGAVTRFVLVERPSAVPARTGADKTSLVVFPGEDHPGGLLEVLTEFSMRGINLVRIESRPTGQGLGRYCFSLDAEGHLDDARMAEALKGLHRVCAEVKFLGSYPRVDATGTGAVGAPVVAPAVTDDAYLESQAWLDGLKGGA